MASPTPSRSGLDCLFAPKSVAILGASADQSRSGGRVHFSLRATRFEGEIFLVNPSRDRIADEICYRSVASIGRPIDLAAICVSAEHVPAAIRECGRAGVRAAIVFADGFNDPELKSRLEQALGEARDLCGLRLLGPNSVGIRNSASWAYVTFSWRYPDRLKPGGVATVTQSGGMATVFGKAMLRERGLGPRYVIDTGGELDVDAAESIAYVADDPLVECISVVIEGCKDGSRLIQSLQYATSRGKPVVFFKTGRSEAAMEVVASHTGSLAGRTEVFDSVIRDAGACVVQDEGELIDAILLHSYRKVPKGRGLGVITGSGGFGILTIDAAAKYGMDMPQPTRPLDQDVLKDFPGSNPGNPFDIGAGIGATVGRWGVAIRWMASQPDVHAIVIWQASILLSKPEQDKLYPILAEVTRDIDKPLFCCGLMTRDFEEKLRGIGVLTFLEPTKLVHAISLVAPARVPRSAPETPAPAPVSGGRGAIAGARARAILAGIPALPHVPTIAIHDADEALRVMNQLCIERAVLKVESEIIAHKTEFGLVTSALEPARIGEGFLKLEAARRKTPDPTAPIVLQPFVQGTEIALGGYTDPVFGPIVMVALGGIYLEILRDAAFARAPVTMAKAAQMIASLRASHILYGARGKPLADVAALGDAIVAFSQFFAANSDDYAEIDLNPLIVHERGKGVTAVDILLVPARSRRRP